MIPGGPHHVELWVPALTRARREWGWPMAGHCCSPETHPYAGGPDHYAAYLANTDGFEVELVARRQK
jgi:hypothetical protein